MPNPTPRRNRRVHQRPRCAATGLIRLRDKKDATLELRAAFMMRAKAEANGTSCSWTVVRAWKCSSCHGHHLSSRPAAAKSVTA